MKHERDFDMKDAGPQRNTGRAMLRGWRCRCPNCGGGPMMDGYLKVRKTCAACGEELFHHRADDMPAWATMIVVGKVIVAALVGVEAAWAPPVWVHFVVWPTAGLLFTLWLLPRIKGAIVGMQWAMRMHGFEGAPSRSDAGQSRRPRP